MDRPQSHSEACIAMDRDADVNLLPLRDHQHACSASDTELVARLPSDRKEYVGRRDLLRAGYLLEATTLAWNVVGVVVLAFAAVAARSVALGGFGLDSLIEIGASSVVIWELTGTGERRQRQALRLIGGAFLGLALYLAVQSSVVLAVGYHPRHSPLGVAWTAATAVAMFLLAAGKARIGKATQNPVLLTEGQVTLVDGLLATAIVIGLLLNALAGWWWADPVAAFSLVLYALKEGWSSFR